MIPKLYLAPLAGVTDSAFRRICKEHGADVLCTEMISAKGLYYNDKKTSRLSEFDTSEHPIGIQQAEEGSIKSLPTHRFGSLSGRLGVEFHKLGLLTYPREA